MRLGTGKLHPVADSQSLLSEPADAEFSQKAANRGGRKPPKAGQFIPIAPPALPQNLPIRLKRQIRSKPRFDST
jgi:hypothetical protein